MNSQESETDQELLKAKQTGFEPKIVGFLCNWCSYAGADKAGLAQLSYPPNVRVVKIMCTGRMDPQFVLHAFDKGADGVIILGCHPGDCHYKEQNYRAVQRHRILLRILREFGISEERCLFDFVSAAEGEKYARVIGNIIEKIRALGPLNRAKLASKDQVLE
ncbi:MAG: hydrogenase iron-sulfur subunit [Candidatus Riflebacteria bacterium]|nr:hydrogenase iron-sulfur subunit [Candidatus Riflebacteria bacterium]